MKNTIVFVGGHHSSALPIMNALLSDENLSLVWFGRKFSGLKDDTSLSLEYNEITKQNIPFVDVQTAKVYKRYNPINYLKVIFAFFQCLYELQKYQPVLVVSFGGYLAVPVAMAAAVLGIPIITHEQTMVAGFANRFIGILSDRILISWPHSEKFFSKEKTVLAGLPLRSNIFEAKSTNFEANNGLPYLYITAGKTGSVAINKMVLDVLKALLQNFNIIHQTGDYSLFNSYEALSGAYKLFEGSVSGKLFLRKHVLEDEIGEAYSRASIVLGRSGIHTCAEILALKKPSVLIPISGTSHGEQNINAEFVKECGLAEILIEEKTTPEILFKTLLEVYENIKIYKPSTTYQEYLNTASINSTKIFLDTIYGYTSKEKTQ